MPPKSSRDIPGSEPRKDKARDTREAAVKTPEKTNDWDWDRVHGDGHTVGIKPEQDVKSK